MDKYCTNCGNKLNEEADVCLKCGKYIKKQILKKGTYNNIKTKEILSILSMIFGIISFLLIFILALALEEVRSELFYETYAVRFFVSIIYTMFSFIPAIPSLILSVIGLKGEKNVYGTIGLITSLLSLTFSIFIIGYITI